MSDAKKHKSSEPQGSPKSDDQEHPSAGPHAKPELTNPDSTPGAGTLPDPGSSDPSDADASG